MKRIMIAVVIGAIAFGSMWAFAATLTVNTKTLGAGNGTVASCNATATIAYNTAYVQAAPGYRVTTAPITSAAACGTMTYKATLTGAANVSLGEATGTLDGTGAATADFTAANVNASAVTGVSVVITG